MLTLAAILSIICSVLWLCGNNKKRLLKVVQRMGEHPFAMHILGGLVQAIPSKAIDDKVEELLAKQGPCYKFAEKIRAKMEVGMNHEAAFGDVCKNLTADQLDAMIAEVKT